MNRLEDVLELRFGVTGGALRASDGYRLFAAMKARGLTVDADPPMQILGDRRGVLIRAPRSRVAVLAAASGAELDVDGSRVRLGAADVREPRPASSLACWMATINGKTDGPEFAVAVVRQIDAMGVGSCGVDVGERRVVAVKGRLIVGFRLTVDSLSDRDSLTLQARGVGGRNRFGCGVMEAGS